MLRNLFLGTLIAGLVAVPGAKAEELAKTDAAATARPANAPSANRPIQDLYMLCAFYPKAGTCEQVYRQAMSDDFISAEAVKAEYSGYARYLGGSSNLTDTDRQYLKDNGIAVPDGLNSTNIAGLHNVINNSALNADAKRIAINNFISRAVQAELYCGFNSCEDRQEAKEGSVRKS